MTNSPIRTQVDGALYYALAPHGSPLPFLVWNACNCEACGTDGRVNSYFADSPIAPNGVKATRYPGLRVPPETGVCDALDGIVTCDECYMWDAPEPTPEPTPESRPMLEPETPSQVAILLASGWNRPAPAPRGPMPDAGTLASIAASRGIRTDASGLWGVQA